MVFGAPGAGKGTQSALLAEKFSLTQLSTGELLRAEIAADTRLGRQIAELVSRGELCGDEMVLRVLRAAVAGTKGGLILDGFPRNLAQAERLDELFSSVGKRLDAAIYIGLPTSELLGRIVGRLVCGGCGATYHRRFKPPKAAGICDACGGMLTVRKDDNPEAVKTRLDEYQKKTMPLLEFYRARGLLKEIDGLGTVAEVAERIRRHIKFSTQAVKSTR